MTGRGSLRVYLGSAPGVGKTFAMLDEGHRRARRGTDVVVAFVETHGRPHTAAKLEGLEVIPRRTVVHRGAEFDELDLAAVLARRPEVALVDELAHTNIPGSGEHEKRWEDVEDLLAAGIDVITTVNVQHLESLNDVVESITGVPQRETVPDAVVRAAEQVELVDMTAEALRRRMSHGNIYQAEKVDAALSSYFRIGNLTALRELALLWLADAVDEGLQRYRDAQGIDETWETRERVVVAVPGGPEGDTLVRRAARIAARASGGELLAVHVARSDGLVGSSPADLVGQRQLTESLGGTWHSVVGDDVPQALLDFARSVNATQIVLGASRRKAWARALGGEGTGSTVARMSGAIDVHMVSHEHAAGGSLLPAMTGGLTARRRTSGAVAAAVLLTALTLLCTHLRGDLSLGSDLLLYLLAVIVTSVIGGFWPALAAAVAGTLLINYYFLPPVHRFTIASESNIIALGVFVLAAALVSRVVDQAARRSTLAARLAAEAETLSGLATSLVRGDRAVPALMERVRETFGADSVCLARRGATGREGWIPVATVGEPVAGGIASDVAVGEDLRLTLSGRGLAAQDHRILAAFAARVGAAYEQGLIADALEAAAPLVETDRQRTALLNAVSHDLRTPLSSAKAAVSSLLSEDVSWTDEQRRTWLHEADTAMDRLTELVTSLLDLSRLQAGVLPVLVQPVGLDDVVNAALRHVARDDTITVDVPADLPEVLADAGLLQRVVANLVQNALRFNPTGNPVRLSASAHGDAVELRVVDRGRGISDDQRTAVFEPFQRYDDAPVDGAGVGLGLAVARGLAQAMGGDVDVEHTPGGGATLVVTLKASRP